MEISLPYRPVDAFNQGVQFLAAAEALARNGNYIFEPIIVNAAFGVECLLKAILAHQREPTKGHELKKLFDAAFKESDIRKKFVVSVMEASGLPVQDFEAELLLCTKNFEKYRYAFEERASVVSGPVPNLATNPGFLIFMGRQLELYFQFLTNCADANVRKNPTYSANQNFGYFDHTNVSP